MRFSLGRVVATAGALRALEKAEQLPAAFLDRHVHGLYGCSEHGRRRPTHISADAMGQR
jgi:hypothetical protein